MNGQNLPPTVQNCPNLFSEATRKPLSSVVTFVSCCSLSRVAYFGAGKPGGAFESGVVRMSAASALPLAPPVQNLR